MDHPGIIDGLCMDYPLMIHGLSMMDYPWIIHGFSLDYRWIIYGFSVAVGFAIA
jgi:hypothetical protein